MRRTRALIVGGGPAGAAAAIMLARSGSAPELIERTRGPHDTVCGGFLGWDASAALRRLGVDGFALGHPIGRLRLVANGQRVEAALPHAAIGMSRRFLDETLLKVAAEAGARVVRGRSVKACDPSARVLRLDDGEELAAEALFLATGKHELRGTPRDLARRAEAPSIGLRAVLPTAPERADLAGVCELHLFDGGYAGLLVQEDGRTNLAISASRQRLADAGSPAALIAEIMAEAPMLGDRVGADLPSDWTTIAGVPYGWRAASTEPGLFRLGDQGAVVSSIAGDGVAIALTSGIAAADAYRLHGSNGATGYQRRFSRRARLPLFVAEALRGAAEDGGRRSGLMRLAGVPSLTRLAARLTRIG